MIKEGSFSKHSDDKSPVTMINGSFTDIVRVESK